MVEAKAELLGIGIVTRNEQQTGRVTWTPQT